MKHSPETYIAIDFDSTFMKVEALEELAEIVLAGKPEKDSVLEEIKRITNLGVDGKIGFNESLSSRMALLPANRQDIEALVDRLKSQVSTSFARNKEFFEKYEGHTYIISNGFKEFIAPIVAPYHIESDHVLANTFEFDDEGKIIGFDQENPLAHSKGKSKVLAKLDLDGDIYVIGDSYTDYEMKEAGIAHKFFAFTENVLRENILERADHITPTLDEFLYVNDMPRANSFPKNRIKALLLEGVHPGAAAALAAEGYQIETLPHALSEDELCDFEQLPYDKFSGKFSSWAKEAPSADDGYLREVLRDGLREQKRIGVNPFKWGFVGSTDTHLGLPGAVDEKNFLGHGGAGTPAEVGAVGLPDDLEFNPGGLAVLYAEQNTRDSLFAAMKRREAYGTSGPRIKVRFFGGWGYPANLCDSAEFVKHGYDNGVPMGGDLPARDVAAVTEAPRFAVQAMQDPGVSNDPGTPLQRIQIIKGWVDSEGQSQESVFDVVGDANNGATVDLSNCKASGKGFQNLCTVWQDPSFDAMQNAYYYARVVENPSCRWSQYICSANKVDCANPDTIVEGLEACCSIEHRPTIQERAWTSPIWYTAEP